MHHLPVDVGSPIVSCSVADPYIMVMTDDGQIVFVQLKTDTENEEVKLQILGTQLAQVREFSTTIRMCMSQSLDLFYFCGNLSFQNILQVAFKMFRLSTVSTCIYF